MKISDRAIRSIVPFLLLSILSYLFVVIMFFPYLIDDKMMLYLLSFLSLFFGYCALHARDRLRLFFLSFCSISMAFLIANLCFLILHKDAGDLHSGAVVRDDVLGYVLKKNTTYPIKLDELTYSNTYTIDGIGRVTSYDNLKKTNQLILAFGCSHTFGLGVDDLQTWPAVLQSLFGGNYKIYNLAVFGYGIQEFLRLLEVKQSSVILNESYPVKYVVYFAIPDHVIRLNTVTYWLTDRPWYVQRNNEIVYNGMYSDSYYNRFTMLLKKSLLFQNDFYNLDYTLDLIGDKEIDLYIKAIDYLQALVKTHLQSELIIVFNHDPAFYFDKRVFDKLNRRYKNFISIFDVFGSGVKAEDIAILGNDHPSANSHQAFATYLHKYITEKEKNKEVGLDPTIHHNW